MAGLDFTTVLLYPDQNKYIESERGLHSATGTIRRDIMQYANHSTKGRARGTKSVGVIQPNRNQNNSAKYQ